MNPTPYKTTVKIIICLLFTILAISCKNNTRNNTNTKRIVSLAPAITTILYDIDADDSLVGVTDNCHFEKMIENDVKIGKVIRLGGYDSINLELVASLNPTIVFCMDSMSIEFFNSLKKTIGEDKVHSFIHPQTYEEIFTMINTISDISGYKSEGDKKIEALRKKYDALLEVTNKIAPDKRKNILVEIYYPPFVTSGTNTFITEIIKTAGGNNIVKSDVSWPNITMEDIYKMDPDLILKLHTTKVHDSLKEIKPYKNNSVFIPENMDMFLQPGIYSVDAAYLLYDFINKKD